MSKLPDLSIIIVSWNVKDWLKSCLDSIYKYAGDLAPEVIVVDNQSHDRTAEMVRLNFAQVKLMTNEKNVGYATANNQGYAVSKGEYILFLNPDTLILPDTLATMIDFMAGNEKIGIAGCQHLNPDQTLQPSVRRFPTLSAIFLIISKLAKVFPNLPPLNRYLARDFDYHRLQPVDQVAGSFFLCRRAMLQQIGAYDENFFTWFEEVDLCRRAQKAGWQVWYNPAAQIIHHGGRSFKQQLVYKNQKNFIKSAWHYFRKSGLR